MSRDVWVGEQIALVRDHERRADRAPRRRVKIRWWTEGPRARRRAHVTAALSRLWSARPLDAGAVFVALYEATDPVGTPPFLVLRVGPDEFAESQGRAIVTAVGEAVPGGALVLETRQGTVIPAEPPATPGDGVPAWSEVDAER
jgi:hypothetical protein